MFFCCCPDILLNYLSVNLKNNGCLKVNLKKNISYVGIDDRYSAKLADNKDCHYDTDKFPIYISQFSKRGFFFDRFFIQH